MVRLRRLEIGLFYFFLFCIPLQTRVLLFTWGASFNEWMSAFFYVTDGIFLALLGLWLIRLLPFIPHRFRALRTSWNAEIWKHHYLFMFPVFAISSILAQIPMLSLWQFFKILEGGLLFFYLKSNLHRFEWGRIALVFVASAFFQAVLTVGQFTFQSDLGLRHIESGPLGPTISGVAKIGVEGVKIIRGYGTFSHPNALAAFLFWGIFFLLVLALTKRELVKQEKWLKFPIFEIGFAAFLFILFLGLGATFSRAVIGIGGMAILFFFVFLYTEKAFRGYREGFFLFFTIFLIAGIAVALLLAPFLLSRFAIDAGEEALEGRISDLSRGASFFSQHPIFGVGLGNYVSHFREAVPYLPWWRYEPIHNIYLMVAVETGTAGLFGFFYFLGFVGLRGVRAYQIFRSHHEKLFILFSVTLFGVFFLLMTIDHYLWTLQQGRLMFWTLAGIIAGLGEGRHPEG